MRWPDGLKLKMQKQHGNTVVNSPDKTVPTGRKTSCRQRGDKTEDAALAFLESRGMVLITRNYHCRYGEIDLIMRDGKTTVFVEVRYRKTAGYGGALASITPSKQRKIALTAQHYLTQQKRPAIGDCRFDVIAVTRDQQQTDQSPHWISGAFDSPL